MGIDRFWYWECVNVTRQFCFILINRLLGDRVRCGAADGCVTVVARCHVPAGLTGLCFAWQDQERIQAALGMGVILTWMLLNFFHRYELWVRAIGYGARSLYLGP